jgi:hypothetical protein
MRSLVLLLLVAGCSIGQSPFSSGAAKDVRRASHEAWLTMSKLDRASTAESHAAAVLHRGTVVIDVVSAHGDGYDGHLVLRIHSDHPASRTGVASSAEACFRYDLGDRRRVAPEEVSCSEGDGEVGLGDRAHLADGHTGGELGEDQPRGSHVEDREIGDDPLDAATAGVGQRALLDDLG